MWSVRWWCCAMRWRRVLRRADRRAGKADVDENVAEERRGHGREEASFRPITRHAREMVMWEGGAPSSLDHSAEPAPTEQCPPASGRSVVRASGHAILIWHNR